MLNESFFTNNILIAPVAHLGIPSRDIKKIFSFESLVKEKSFNETTNELINVKEYVKWTVADKVIRAVHSEKGMKSCVFCDRETNITLTFPVFEIIEHLHFIKLVKMHHACTKCETIVKLNPSGEQAAIRQMKIIINGLGSNNYHSNQAPEEMIQKAKEKKMTYAQMNWDWDFTFLVRRGFSNIRIFSSEPVKKFDHIKGRPFVTWAGVVNTKEYLNLDGKKNRPNIVTNK